MPVSGITDLLAMTEDERVEHLLPAWTAICEAQEIQDVDTLAEWVEEIEEDDGRAMMSSQVMPTSNDDARWGT